MSLENLSEAQILIRLEECWFLPLMVRGRRLDEILGHLDQLLVNEQILSCQVDQRGPDIHLCIRKSQSKQNLGKSGD